MIRINLLPPYVHEAQRIKKTIIVFVVLFILLAGIVFKWQADLKGQQAWFADSAKTFATQKTKLDKYVADVGLWKGKTEKYNPWISFFERTPVKDYNQQVTKTMVEVAEKLAGNGAWFSTVTIQGDGNFTASGEIRGSMQFLSYYFRIRDIGGKLEPAVQPIAKDVRGLIPLAVSWQATAFPNQPAPPGTGGTPDTVYKPAAAGGGAPGAPVAPGGAMPADPGGF